MLSDIANKALNVENMLLKVRPVQQASAESKKMAKRKIDYLKPYKPRPQTSSLVATNLIGASLGMRNLMSKEKVALERKKLANARGTSHCFMYAMQYHFKLNMPLF
jgi:hypothetical protein